MMLIKLCFQCQSAYRALIVVYVLLALIYSVSTPVFEAPDEYYHFAFITHLVRTGTLPPSEHPQEHAWRQMVYHAPLYYLISATFAAPFDISDFPSRYPLNPHARIGYALAPDNVNFVAHVDDWHGAGLALHVVRLVSIVFGVVTLCSIYMLSCMVFPDDKRVALLAVLIVMLNPQFLFISGVVSNDNAVTAFTTASLALVARITQHQITMRRIFLLGLLMAAASLSKASGLVLYVVVLPVLWWVWRKGWVSWRRALACAAVIFTVWVGIAGWWYGRNLLLYGDFSASGKVAEATSLRGEIPDLIGELRGLYFSFWGLFGWFNISAPLGFYHWTLLLLGAACVGGVIGFLRRNRAHRVSQSQRFLIGFLCFYMMVFVAAWSGFNQKVQAGQGRLWFPLLCVFALIIARGLSRLPRGIVLVLLVGLGVSTVSFPFTLLVPAYAPAPQIAAATWHPPENAVAMRFREPWSDSECLILWAIPPEWQHQVGTPITLRVYWQSLCPMTGYWSIFIHFVDPQLDQCLVGDNRHVFAQLDTMPEGGRLPLPAFQPGSVINDSLTLYPPEGIDLSRNWYLQGGLYDAGGTFIRAFVDGVGNDNITIGRCAPESILWRIP